jgi:tetratricopeptide (TPR) repeat protein
MITVPVQFRYSPRPQRPACALLIPGDDAAAWVSELADWNVPLTSLELFILPLSQNDLRPRGVLVRFPKGTVALQTAGHPYGVVADRLFVPVETTIHPHVTDREWQTLLGPDYVACVWHPLSGLVGFEAADRLRVADLLSLPAATESDWGRADSGIAFNARLISVEAERFPTPDEVLETGRDDIGSRSKDRSGLPRSPRETLGRVLGGIAAGIAAPFAYAAHWLAQHAPRGCAAGGSGGGAAGRSWLDRLEEWAGNILQNAAALWNARKRELDRLLHLLDDNPDEGLKYAIPHTGGGDAHRGRARPGTRLGARNVDFSLGGLFGGGLADVWDVPGDYQLRLLERYRQLAEREVRLGRHRRAAYIYAHLLADLSAAAATLAAGGHYREAAVLYRDKLKRPADAARCLEQGGLLHEAIPIFEELGDFVRVGDLYTRLEQPDDARAAWRRAVDSKLQQRDHLGAAALLEQKLDSADEALAALDAGWPDSAQARQCLDESFQLLARGGRHDEAVQRVGRLRDEPVSAARVPALVEGLARAAESYPDRRLQHSAADAARVVASRALVSRNSEARTLLGSIAQLVPQDRLLERDCRRYTRSTAPRPKPAAPPPTARGHKVPELVRRILLPGPTEWVAAASTPNGFYLAGYRARELVLVRGAWRAPEAPLTEVSWKSHLLSGAPLLMSVDEFSPIAVRLLIPGGPPLPPRSLPPAQDFPNHVSAETPGWLSDDTIGMDAACGVTWAVEVPQLALKCFNRDGQPIALRGLPLPALMEISGGSRPSEPIPVHIREDGVFGGIGTHLFRVSRGDRLDSYDFESPIRSIVGSGSFTRARVAVLCEQGGSVCWPNYKGSDFIRLPHDLEAPQGVFLRDGRLLLCTHERWLVCATQRGRLELDTVLPPAVPDPLAVLQTREANEFAVCSGQREMLVYRLPV